MKTNLTKLVSMMALAVAAVSCGSNEMEPEAVLPVPEEESWFLMIFNGCAALLADCNIRWESFADGKDNFAVVNIWNAFSLQCLSNFAAPLYLSCTTET